MGIKVLSVQLSSILFFVFLFSVHSQIKTKKLNKKYNKKNAVGFFSSLFFFFFCMNVESFNKKEKNRTQKSLL